jgi:hypothetical protein
MIHDPLYPRSSSTQTNENPGTEVQAAISPQNLCTGPSVWLACGHGEICAVRRCSLALKRWNMVRNVYFGKAMHDTSPAYPRLRPLLHMPLPANSLYSSVHLPRQSAAMTMAMPQLWHCLAARQRVICRWPYPFGHTVNTADQMT